MNTTFLYTEVQASIPFDQFNWEQANSSLKQAPGLLSKTWLAGLGTHTIGGLYLFDSVENALGFAHGPWSQMARQVGVAASTRIFDAKRHRGRESPNGLALLRLNASSWLTESSSADKTLNERLRRDDIFAQGPLLGRPGNLRSSDGSTLLL